MHLLFASFCSIYFAFLCSIKGDNSYKLDTWFYFFRKPMSGSSINNDAGISFPLEIVSENSMRMK